ncbi:MAG: AbrB/MazE/SpoVT family DNA-binding domain-containing protein [Ruminococcaceae bacterium]|nr:AbrB/MazE/SpoVT family DNA-binding domain-containing protein [Oscillospiraceae bacterium]
MKPNGIIRDVDKMGRVVIPKEIRNQLNIKSDVDSLEIFMEGDSIVLRKYKPACFFCDTLEETVNYNGYSVCVECIEKLKKLKEELE